MKKFWTQTQAQDKGWSDVLGTNDPEAAISFAKFEIASGKSARVVQRVDAVVWAEEGSYPSIEQRLKHRIHTFLDNAFIWIGGKVDASRRQDYRLHPMFAKDFGMVESKLVEIVKEIYE